MNLGIAYVPAKSREPADPTTGAFTVSAQQHGQNLSATKRRMLA